MFSLKKNSSGVPATPKIKTDIATAAAGMTFFVMTVVVLYFGREVLVPITLALVLAFMLAPLVRLLRKLHIGQLMPVLVAVALALGVITILGGVIGSQIADLSSDLPQYVAKVEQKIAGVKRNTVGRITDMARSVGQTHVTIPGLIGPTSSAGTTTTSAGVSVSSAPLNASPLDLAERYLSPILSPFATLGLIFIVAVFALLQWENLHDRLVRLTGSHNHSRAIRAFEDAARRLSRYFVTQLCINTLFGVTISLGLLIIGVPNPLLWGILSAILRFVPYIGSMLSAILPVTLAAGVESGWSMVAWTVGLYFIVEIVTGEIIEPLIYGHSTGLTPFSVVVAAIFWSWVWGPIGLILSTPLTLCLVVLGRHFKPFEFLDILLGDDQSSQPKLVKSGAAPKR